MQKPFSEFVIVIPAVKNLLILLFYEYAFGTLTTAGLFNEHVPYLCKQ